MRNLLFLTITLLLFSCGKDDDLADGCTRCQSRNISNIEEVQKYCDGEEYDLSIFKPVIDWSEQIICDDSEKNLFLLSNGSVLSGEGICDAIIWEEKLETNCD